MVNGKKQVVLDDVSRKKKIIKFIKENMRCGGCGVGASLEPHFNGQGKEEYVECIGCGWRSNESGEKRFTCT